MTLTVILSVAALLLLFALLYWMNRQHYSFSARVFTALGLGLLLGGALHLLTGQDADTLDAVRDWYALAGTGYVHLLQMISMPLVFISILAALTRMDTRRNLAGTAGRVIAWLVGLTAVAALIGMASVALFGLDASQIVQGQAELERGATIAEKAATVGAQTVPQRLLELLPTNPFLDLTGARPTSTIATVIFAALLGIAYLGIADKKPAEAATFRSGVDALHAVTMRLVQLILRLTPYGVLAILASTVAATNYAAIVDLGKFVLASYAALITMLLVQLAALALSGLNPLTYLRKAAPVMLFAFSSRSSAGTLPLNIQAQREQLGVEEGTANLAGSLGISIGQNGCAGVYPAMLAFMIAPTVGINPMTPDFILTLMGVVALSSFGVAGVGGGATFAAILVLSSMNLPVALAGILISVEPLIDMGRTALNVSGSMVAGTLTSRSEGTLDRERYNGAAVAPAGD
ncbi:L-cystine transporter [Deinococcus sp. Marseille-Q6407]|uniref:L-cystine transporter n=1 Tax=Deinococcus sp. Marseille-Q6407 TaxID=2969223 RepID=UPI0028FC1462|nr:cation:dicarboxylase symporter family transporter [Deinococcus sp. Marseille-Q6407]